MNSPANTHCNLNFRLTPQNQKYHPGDGHCHLILQRHHVIQIAISPFILSPTMTSITQPHNVHHNPAAATGPAPPSGLPLASRFHRVTGQDPPSQMISIFPRHLLARDPACLPHCHWSTSATWSKDGKRKSSKNYLQHGLYRIISKNNLSMMSPRHGP